MIIDIIVYCKLQRSVEKYFSPSSVSNGCYIIDSLEFNNKILYSAIVYEKNGMLKYLKNLDIDLKIILLENRIKLKYQRGE